VAPIEDAYRRNSGRKERDVAGGIGDFSVSAGMDGTFGNSGKASHSPRAKPIAVPGGFPDGARLHYILLAGEDWRQSAPLRFHNGHLDELKTRLEVTAKVPLPGMPGFLPAGSEGEMRFQGRHAFHPDAALREQPLFSHLESLRALVQRCADRRLAFPEFAQEINRIPIPSPWRDEIVNGLFENAGGVPPEPAAAKGKVAEDLDRIMGMFKQEDKGGSALSPHLDRFLEEVGKDSTGFILRDGAAKELLRDLSRTLEALRGGMLRHPPLARALAILASLQRLAKSAKGRERQTVHLWSDIPSDPGSILAADSDGSVPDAAAALVLLDPLERNSAFLRAVAGLAARLNVPLLVQVPGEDIPPGHPALEALAEGAPVHTYFFAGGVAARVDGEECVFRPAALAFLEGLVAGRETVDFYLHRAMVLEDQDIVTEKGQARATDRLLDNAEWEAVSAARINRVNGVRNRTEARFPLLRPWKDS
jgi:hypothetical protein